MLNKTAENILKKSGFKRASSEIRVATAISQLSSTHDALFIFKKERFSGLVNLYHSFSGKKTSGEEKVARCLYHPPIISPKDSLIEVARLMVESRVYRLPVLKGEEFLGVIFAEDILRWAKGLSQFKGLLVRDLPKREPIYLTERESVDQAIHLMIKRKTNRLLITTKEGKTVGILTLYDLRNFFTKPRDRISFLSRTPIKREFTRRQVGKVSRRLIISVREGDSLFKAINLILANKVGSLVVFADSGGQSPLGLIVFRDLLKLIADLDKKAKETNFGRGFGRKQMKVAQEIVRNKLGRLLKYNPLFAKKVRSINLDLRPVAKGGANLRLPLLEVTASIRLDKGNKIFRVKSRGRKITLMADDIISKMKSLLRKQKSRRND